MSLPRLVSPGLLLLLAARVSAQSPAAPPATVSFDPIPWGAYAGTAVPIRARGASTDATGAVDTTVVWRSSDTRTAWVSADGMLFFERAGRVTITAAAGTATAQREFEVRDARADRLTTTLTPAAALASPPHEGDERMLGARALDGGRPVADAPITYAVGLRGADRAAVLDSTGRFVADAPGSYPLMALFGDVGTMVDVPVAAASPARVTAPLPRGADRGDGVRDIDVDQPGDWAPYVGTSLPLVARVTPASGAPAGAPAPAATWSSSDPETAWVDDAGVVHFLKRGSVRIAATAGGHRATRDFRVLDAEAYRVLLRAGTTRGALPAVGDSIPLEVRAWGRAGAPIQHLRAELGVSSAGGAVTAPRVSITEDGVFVAHEPGTYVVTTVVDGHASRVVIIVGAGRRAD